MKITFNRTDEYQSFTQDWPVIPPIGSSINVNEKLEMPNYLVEDIQLFVDGSGQLEQVIVTLNRQPVRGAITNG